ETGRKVARWLLERGHTPIAETDEFTRLDIDGCGLDTAEADVDLVVSIGGGGTMLRATRRAVEASAHVFGVNLGSLAYLAEVESSGWETALESYFAGRFQIAERLMVSSQLWPVGAVEPISSPAGLNEVVIEKQD